MLQAVPSELKIQQEFKDLLMENTEKVLLSVHQVPRVISFIRRRECRSEVHNLSYRSEIPTEIYQPSRVVYLHYT
jgi:hypothetical protein